MAKVRLVRAIEAALTVGGRPMTISQAAAAARRLGWRGNPESVRFALAHGDQFKRVGVGVYSIRRATPAVARKGYRQGDVLARVLARTGPLQLSLLVKRALNAGMTSSALDATGPAHAVLIRDPRFARVASGVWGLASYAQ